MKNFAFLFIPLVSTFSFGCFAQSNNPAYSEKGNTPGLPNNEESVIVSYRVVETVGGSITTYTVSNLSLVDKNDLGPKNTRVITPNYKKLKVKPKLVSNTPSPIAIAEKAPVQAPLKIESPDKMYAVVPIKKATFIMVDILSTYERILEKGGYESVEMLKKVANNRYFKGDLTVAYKWYAQLFAQTSDLEVEYYYRYALALKAVGQVNKAEEMMKLFESKLTK